MRRVAFGLLIFGTGCSAGASPSSQPPSTGATNGGEAPAWAGKRRDEPFDVKGFLASRSAPTDNAAPLYLAALKPICGAIDGGDKTPLEKEIAELGDVEKLAAGAIAPKRIDDVLARAAPILAQIDVAQARPNCVFVTGLYADSTMPHVLGFLTLSRLYALQLAQATGTGDFKQAEAAVGRSLRLARDLTPRGSGVCQLAAIAIESTILSGIQRLMLTDSRLTAVQIDRLLELLQAHRRQMPRRVEEGLKIDFITSRNSIEDLRSGRLTIDEIGEFLSGNESDDDPPPGPPNFNWGAEIAACNELYSQALVAARKPTYRAAKVDKLGEELARREMEARRFTAMFSSMPRPAKAVLRSQAPSFTCVFFASPAPVFIEANFRAEAGLAGTQVLLALRRYQIVHGKLPPNLKTPAAECLLKTVPVDPFDGEPLRFATVDGKPTVYSVGKDLKDDGGQADWDYGQKPGDILFVLPETR
jgi:hypothetical protein